MTIFHLVRHASHGLLGSVLAGRTPKLGLSDTGRAQAAALAERFKAQPVAAVISSPVQRAIETAMPIAAALGLSVQADAGLEEIDFGRWTGAGFADLAGDPGWDDWNAARGLAPTPGGETMLAAQARAIAALGGLRGRYGDAAVVVVSHADIIKAILAHILGMPLDLIHRFDIAPASTSTLGLGDAHAVVHSLNHP